MPLATVHVDLDHPGATIAADFVGLGTEYGADLARTMFGASATATNQGFQMLVSRLPRSSFRLGGNSADETCYDFLPAPREPRGCQFQLKLDDLGAIAATLGALGWRIVIDLNLAQNQPDWALSYAKAVLQAVPASAIEGLEIGNEPDDYWRHAFYADGDGGTVMMRDRSYDPDAGAAEWEAHAAALAADPATAGVPLWGPSLAHDWAVDGGMARYLARMPRLPDVVATHFYSFSACAPEGDPTRVTLGGLLDEATMASFRAQMGDQVAAARAISRPLDIDEVNSAFCHGLAGVTDTFAGALWGLDWLFEAAAAGVARAHVQTGSGWHYTPIDSSNNTNTTEPLYWSLVLFADAQGGALLPVTLEGARANVKAWAVRAPDNTTRIFVLNKDLSAGGEILLAPSSTAGRAQVTVLRAPSLDDLTHATLAPAENVSADGNGRYRIPLPNATILEITL